MLHAFTSVVVKTDANRDKYEEISVCGRLQQLLLVLERVLVLMVIINIPSGSFQGQI